MEDEGKKGIRGFPDRKIVSAWTKSVFWLHVDHDRSRATGTYIKMSAWFGYHQSSGAV